MLNSNQNSNMSQIEQPDIVKLGYQQIDDDHKQFMGLLMQLQAADNNDFPILFKQLFAHTQMHFDMENQLMDEFTFPALADHKGEHQRVIGEFKQFNKLVEKGLLAFGRSFVCERLPQWFELHIATMDSALIAHINKQLSRTRTLKNKD